MRFLTVLLLSFVLTVSAFAQSNKPLAGNFTGTSLDGTEFDLSALKGKVVLVTFWSTRCVICASEVPKLNQMAATYKGQDVVFLALTTENPDKVKNYIKKKTFDFNLLPNSFGTLLQYADKDGNGQVTMGYPAYFLINQKGEIEVKTEGKKTDLINKQISKLLTTR